VARAAAGGRGNVTALPGAPGGMGARRAGRGPGPPHSDPEHLAGGAATRLRLESLPAYAPETNPDEGIWNLLKRVELGNRCCGDLPHLKAELRRDVLRLRQKPHLIRACIRHAGYLL
jgi:hypothetical protein